jgi:hypothetical protein
VDLRDPYQSEKGQEVCKSARHRKAEKLSLVFAGSASPDFNPSLTMYKHVECPKPQPKGYHEWMGTDYNKQQDSFWVSVDSEFGQFPQGTFYPPVDEDAQEDTFNLPVDDKVT